MCKWSIKALKTGSFPDSLKCANVRPIYKNVDPFDRIIYQWVNYHFYQKLVIVIYKQVSNYFEPFFNEIVRHIDQALLGKGDHSLFFMDLVSIMVT